MQSSSLAINLLIMTLCSSDCLYKWCWNHEINIIIAIPPCTPFLWRHNLQSVAYQTQIWGNDFSKAKSMSLLHFVNLHLHLRSASQSFCAIVWTVMVVGVLLLRARRPEIRCQTVFAIQHWVATFFGVSWRHTFLLNIDEIYLAH